MSGITSTLRDPTGVCCEKVLLDAAGRCCLGRGVDMCGVCGGSNSTCQLSLSLELDWATLGLETTEEVGGPFFAVVPILHTLDNDTDSSCFRNCMIFSRPAPTFSQHFPSTQVRLFLSDRFGVQVSAEQVATLTSFATAAPVRRLHSTSSRGMSVSRAHQRISDQDDSAHLGLVRHSFEDSNFLINMIGWRPRHPLHERPPVTMSDKQLRRRRAEEVLTREQEDEITDWRLALTGASVADEAGQVDAQSELGLGDESASVNTAPDATEIQLLGGNAGRGANEEIGVEVESDADAIEAEEPQATVASVRLTLTVTQLKQLRDAMAAQNNVDKVHLDPLGSGVVGTCGNGVCEFGEGDAGCVSDCQLQRLELSCPNDCNGHGDCDAGSGTCTCFYGYLDFDCGVCALGFVRVNTACVRYFPADAASTKPTANSKSSVSSVATVKKEVTTSASAGNSNPSMSSITAAKKDVTTSAATRISSVTAQSAVTRIPPVLQVSNSIVWRVDHNDPFIDYFKSESITRK